VAGPATEITGLGYINRDKKLVIVPEEAERVRWMFRRYLELGSMGLLLEEMNRLGIRTKAQTLSNGQKRGGVSYGKGALWRQSRANYAR
jgi:site-specific DNA recombinase